MQFPQYISKCPICGDNLCPEDNEEGVTLLVCDRNYSKPSYKCEYSIQYGFYSIREHYIINEFDVNTYIQYSEDLTPIKSSFVVFSKANIRVLSGSEFVPYEQHEKLIKLLNFV